MLIAPFPRSAAGPPLRSIHSIIMYRRAASKEGTQWDRSMDVPTGYRRHPVGISVGRSHCRRKGKWILE